ncbi:RING-type domain-containing protein [Aphelenchoides fujianensis]|nr:RING-type domain-containing protein [Aphelenchoides fujianensis]
MASTESSLSTRMSGLSERNEGFLSSIGGLRLFDRSFLSGDRTLTEFRNTEEVRVAIQEALNNRKHLEDYKALILFVCKEANDRIDRLLVAVCQPNTESQERPNIPLYFRTTGSQEHVTIEARTTDTIGVVKLRLFAHFGIETHSMRLHHGGEELADDHSVSKLPSGAILLLSQKRRPVIREAQKDDKLPSCFKEFLDATASALTLKCEAEVEVLHRLDEFRPRSELLQALETKLDELKAAKPAEFRVHVVDLDDADEKTSIEAAANEPLYVFKFRLANAMKRPSQTISLYLPNGKLADESKCLCDLGIKSGTTLAFKFQPSAPPRIDVQFAAYYFKSLNVFRVWDLCTLAKRMEQRCRRIVCLKATRKDQAAAQRAAAEVVQEFSRPPPSSASLSASASSASMDALHDQLHWARILEGEPEPSNLCIICIERPRETLFLPCEHLIVCSDPFCRDLSVCPLDRRPIEQQVRARLF